MQAYFLYTSEVDDIQLALRQICQQLNEVPLLSSSIGLMACCYEYVENTFIEKLKEVFPFPLIELVAFLQSTPQVGELFSCTITILTNNEVRFAIAARSLETGVHEVQKNI